MQLSNGLMEMVAAKANDKFSQLEGELQQLCQQNNQFSILLAEFKEFFGINLEARLVPIGGQVNAPKTKTTATKEVAPKTGTATYTSFTRQLLPIIEQIGEGDKQFTSADIKTKLKELGITDFTPSWVSLALCKHAEFEKVGQVDTKGKRSMNPYQLKKRQSRRARRKKTKR